MKIVFFGTKPWEKDYLTLKIKDSGVEAGLEFIEGTLNKDNIPQSADCDIISVFVGSEINREVIDKFSNLKLIVTRSTGYDHIDLVACEDRGILVASVPSYGENTVAEHAFALLLCLSRKIYLGYEQIRENGSFNVDNLQGFDLKGKTLGVIGTGRIGKHAIKMANGFDMKVIAYDTYPNKELEKELCFTYHSFNEVLAESDVITIHVPYLKETHHLLNEESINKMKPGAYLINTSRGAVVETEALVKALESGHLGGAGLDVLEEEGVIKDELEFVLRGHPKEHDLKTILSNHVLIDLPNVIVTPHNAFNTKEAIERILDTTVEDITGFIKGKPVNLVKFKSE